jgi:hypothetical protein
MLEKKFSNFLAFKPKERTKYEKIPLDFPGYRADAGASLWLRRQWKAAGTHPVAHAGTHCSSYAHPHSYAHAI